VSWKLWTLSGIVLVVTAGYLVTSHVSPVDPQHMIYHVIRPQLEQQKPPKTVRIGTFNIHSGKGKNGTTDLKSTALVIPANLDYVFLQEVRCQWLDACTPQSTILSDLTNKAAVFLPTEIKWLHPHFGNGLLSSHAFREPELITLPCTRGKAYRQLIHLQVPLDGQNLHILATHLDLFEDHDTQLKIVIEEFKKLPTPKILLGDLNTRAQNPEIQKLLSEEGVVDLLQAQHDLKTGHVGVDWMIGSGARAMESGIVTNEASDHPLLWAEIGLLENEKRP
jgi:endonuclease/exonuclease/phosphatase family metal-dependent hydrolase